ncbi:MAG: glycoside hydrolase family 3 C-terminal domain-containing protein [Betaproteobacteria bacterium]|nr:glycoside hydrolase family 3 C-terminal domain-containing protein [Betaproteobacteria bacterium]
MLLKNDGGLLPLDLQAPVRVAVIGAFAQKPRFQGAGSSQVRPTRIDTLWTELGGTRRSQGRVVLRGRAIRRWCDVGRACRRGGEDGASRGCRDRRGGPAGRGRVRRVTTARTSTCPAGTTS